MPRMIAARHPHMPCHSVRRGWEGRYAVYLTCVINLPFKNTSLLFATTGPRGAQGMGHREEIQTPLSKKVSLRYCILYFIVVTVCLGYYLYLYFYVLLLLCVLLLLLYDYYEP